MFRIERRSAHEVRCDQELVARIRTILEASYEDPACLLARELARATVIYLGSSQGSLVCFFMLMWHLLPLPDGTSMPSVYLGLSASNAATKGRGFTIRLYKRFIADAVGWEGSDGQPLFLWGTTASPLVLRIVHRVFGSVCPDREGRYSELAAVHAQAIRRYLSLSESDFVHPLVLPGIARDTRYRDEERSRHMKDISGPDDIFDRLGISESRGDRLLFMAALPREI